MYLYNNPTYEKKHVRQATLPLQNGKLFANIWSRREKCRHRIRTIICESTTSLVNPIFVGNFYPIFVSNFYIIFVSNFYPIFVSNFYPIFVSNFYPICVSNCYLTFVSNFYLPSN